MKQLHNEPLHQLHKRLMEAQGRKLSWLAAQLKCSYSHVHKYLNGHGIMSQEKIEDLHKILHTVQGVN